MVFFVTVTLGLTKQILDFVHRIAEESATHVRAAGELVTWTAQVGFISTYQSMEAKRMGNYNEIKLVCQ